MTKNHNKAFFPTTSNWRVKYYPNMHYYHFEMMGRYSKMAYSKMAANAKIENVLSLALDKLQ